MMSLSAGVMLDQVVLVAAVTVLGLMEQGNYGLVKSMLVSLLSLYKCLSNFNSFK